MRPEAHPFVDMDGFDVSHEMGAVTEGKGVELRSSISHWQAGKNLQVPGHGAGTVPPVLSIPQDGCDKAVSGLMH